MAEGSMINDLLLTAAEGHPSCTHLLKLFKFEHLPGDLQITSAMFAQLAYDMFCILPDSPEKSVCLRKLLEAKDCAVRARL